MGGTDARDCFREGARILRRREKDSRDIRKASIQRRSSEPSERRRPNQEAEEGGADGGGSGLKGFRCGRSEERAERDVEAEERCESRARVWEGRRWGSWRTRKELAAETAAERTGTRFSSRELSDGRDWAMLRLQEGSEAAFFFPARILRQSSAAIADGNWAELPLLKIVILGLVFRLDRRGRIWKQ